MTKFLTVAAVAAAVFMSAGGAIVHAGPAPENYNALRDFSYNNPNGVWSYGYGAAGDTANFTVYPVGLDAGCGQTEDVISDCFIDAESLVAQNVSGKLRTANGAASSIVIPADALQLHPRNTSQDTIVVFTTPKDGSYQIEGFFEILDNRPSSIAPKIFVNAKDITRKAFSSDVDVVLSGAADPAKKKVGEKRKFSIVQALKKGQRVQFALNPNGDWRFDSTGFDATITPVPAP